MFRIVHERNRNAQAIRELSESMLVFDAVVVDCVILHPSRDKTSVRITILTLV